jgi:hypothetical protein
LEPLLRKKDPLLPDYLTQLIEKKTRAISGVSRASQPDEELRGRLEAELRTLIKLKEETDTWQR